MHLVDKFCEKQGTSGSANPEIVIAGKGIPSVSFFVSTTITSFFRNFSTAGWPKKWRKMAKSIIWRTNLVPGRSKFLYGRQFMTFHNCEVCYEALLSIDVVNNAHWKWPKHRIPTGPHSYWRVMHIHSVLVKSDNNNNYSAKELQKIFFYNITKSLSLIPSVAILCGLLVWMGSFLYLFHSIRTQ